MDNSESAFRDWLIYEATKRWKSSAKKPSTAVSLTDILGFYKPCPCGFAKSASHGTLFSVVREHVKAKGRPILTRIECTGCGESRIYHLLGTWVERNTCPKSVAA